MMKRVLIVLVLLLVASSSEAFDGDRKGFFLGGGVGVAGTNFEQKLTGPSFFSGSDTTVTGESETKASFVTDFMIGWGISSQVLLYYDNYGTWFSIENVFDSKVTIMNAISSVGLSYFFAPTAPSGMIEGGIGISTWSTPFEEDSSGSSGVGIWGGGGYEFSPHWMVRGRIGYGNPSDKEMGLELKTDAISFGVMITGVAY